MKKWRWFVLLPLFVHSLIGASAQQHQQKDDVHWCSTIPIPAVWREAKFTAIFVFDVDANGKPTHIRSVRNPLIKDDGPLNSCISTWSLPSASGKVTANILWEWSCKSIGISVNGSHKPFSCLPPEPASQPNSQ